MKTIWLLLIFQLAAHAAIVRVGHADGLDTAGGNGTRSMTTSYAPTTGNAVWVGCTAWNNSTNTPTSESVSDGGTNTYGLVKSQYDSGRLTVYLHRALNVTGGSFTYTCTVAKTSVVWWVNIFVIEYSGIALSGGDDGTPQSGTGTGSPIVVGAGVTTTSAVDVLVAIWVVGDSNGTITSITPSGGFSAVDSSLNANVNTMGGSLEQIVSSTGTYIAGTARNPTGGSAGYCIVEAALEGAPPDLPGSTLNGTYTTKGAVTVH